MDTLFTIGIFSSFFQGFLLLKKKTKSLPDKILAVWMFVVGIHLINYYIYLLGYWDVFPHLVGVTLPFPFFYGPLLYLYILYSLKNVTQLNRNDYVHFIPVGVTYTYMFKFYFFYSAEQKRAVDSGTVEENDFFIFLFLIAFIISGLCYTFFSYNLLKRHQTILENNFSHTAGINLNWLRSFLIGMGIIFVITIIIIGIRDLAGFTFYFNLDYIFYSLIIFSILVLGYFGIRHENIFIDEVAFEVVNPKAEYKKSGLNNVSAQNLYDNLLDFMNQNKPYLEPKLTLHSLAKKVEATPNHISQVINQYEHQNFNDFINNYRINEFLSRVKENKNYSFLAHALDSGFNSKSTFNAVFKRQKGVNPSVYLKNFPSN